MAANHTNPQPRHTFGLIMVLLWSLGTLLWWGLAFPPGVGVPPPWLARVQAVCFGTGGDGLPAPHGWGALIAGPLGMGVLMLVGWGAELRRALARLRTRAGGTALLAVLAVALLGQTGWVGLRMYTAMAPVEFQANGGVTGPMPASYPRLNRTLPPIALLDQHGASVTLEQYRGRVVYMSFLFGNCATVCPLVAKRMQQAHAQDVAGMGQEAAPALVLITLDPWRDTPPALAGILARWGLPAETAMLGGAIAGVNDALDALQVPRERDLNTGDINHPPLVYVLDRQGQLAYALLNPSPAWIREAGRRAEQ